MFREAMRRYKEKQKLKRLALEAMDRADRKVQRYELTLHMIDGRELTIYTQWHRFNKLPNGIHSYIKLMLKESAINVEGELINTVNVLKISHQLVTEGYVKPEIKALYKDTEVGSEWYWRRNFTSEEVNIKEEE